MAMQDINKITNDIVEAGYVILFCDRLVVDANKQSSKHPDWKGDSVFATTGRHINSGIWENDGYYYCKVGQATPPYANLCTIDLYQHDKINEMYIGEDSVRRHFGTFNQSNGLLIIYRKK
jgi:hypothetical protein